MSTTVEEQKVHMKKIENVMARLDFAEQQQEQRTILLAVEVNDRFEIYKETYTKLKVVTVPGTMANPIVVRYHRGSRSETKHFDWECSVRNMAGMLNIQALQRDLFQEPDTPVWRYWYLPGEEYSCEACGEMLRVSPGRSHGGLTLSCVNAHCGESKQCPECHTQGELVGNLWFCPRALSRASCYWDGPL